jgi:hypothetical protein
MLWAGILFIWELVGIDLEKAKEAGGNFGAMINAIKSLQAVPWVLLILVAYFLFKVSVEWYQCSKARRALRVSRIDFTSAWVVSFIAYALYFGQAASRLQFADVLQTVEGGSVLVGVTSSVGGFVGGFVALLREFSGKGNAGKNRQRFIVYFFLVFALLIFLLGIATLHFVFRLPVHKTSLVVGFVGATLSWSGGIFLAYIAELLSDYVRLRRRR